MNHFIKRVYLPEKLGVILNVLKDYTIFFWTPSAAVSVFHTLLSGGGFSHWFFTSFVVSLVLCLYVYLLDEKNDGVKRAFSFKKIPAHWPIPVILFFLPIILNFLSKLSGWCGSSSLCIFLFEWRYLAVAALPFFVFLAIACFVLWRAVFNKSFFGL